MILQVEQEAKKDDNKDDTIDADSKKSTKIDKKDPARANEATPGADSGTLTTREGRATG